MAGFTVASVAGCAVLTWLYVRRIRAWLSKRGIVTPLALAMAPILNIPELDTEQAITLAPGWMTRKQGQIGQVTLPPRFRANPGQRNEIEHLITTRLPVDIDFYWNTAMNPQRLSIQASPRPPTQVPFAKYADFMHELKQGEVMLGLDRLQKPYTGMLGNNSDNPHWGLSVNTGRGKSTMLLATAVQVLHQDPDAKVLGIDPKMSSLDAIADIPGVTLACDPLDIESMWAEIDRYHADMMERLTEHKRDKLAEFPIDLCMLDEANTCGSMWRSFWAGIRSSKDPATPPIWKAVAEIAWMGRAVRKNLIIVGQRLDAPATGGQGMRDSLGLIGLGGVRANQYKMLVDPTGTAPRFPKIKGRWLYFDSNETTWVQNLLPTMDDLHSYAMHGRTVPVADKASLNVTALKLYGGNNYGTIQQEERDSIRSANGRS